VDYIIFPLRIAKFSNFKALTKPQALKFENLSRSEEKYRNPLVPGNPLVPERNSIFAFLIFMSTLNFHLVILLPN
jgi:hypothetical protein